jgi:hypothetical protein
MFLRCPCCEDKSILHDSSLRIETRKLLADLMGDDINGFITFSEAIDSIQDARISAVQVIA